ncbi:MAG TPA: HD domain-containing protein [Kofleriaceae bacterium]|nr:HD domain-containing protein [Kofleriaceae bacterium]
MKHRVFRDPVHGLIELGGPDRELGRLLETRAFQRLRRLRQMGFASLVYPGAEHSRFGHALGAFHIAQRVARQLRLAPETARHVVVAALLHDIGHGPFSHSWEQVAGDIDHEAWGARIVSEDGELGGALADIEPGLPAALCGFWRKDYRPRFARKLVSSQLDVDRLDYLLRDGHYSGAGYATFDLEWILHALQIRPVHAGDDPDDLVIDYRRGKFAVEQYLFARSTMYAQVYHHKTVRAADWMFLKIMERFRELAASSLEPGGLEPVARMARGAALAVDDYLWLDDISVTHAIDSWAGRGPAAASPAARDDVLRDLSQRLAARRLFKTIELGHDAGVIERLSEPVLRAARARFGDAAHYYAQLDHAKQLGYRASADDELHVVGHPVHGTVTLGQLLEDIALGRPMSTIRLMCAPELVDVLRPIAERELRSTSTSS